MNLTLSISPCPNDTFMFDAIINKKIDLKGYNFDVDFKDIEQLNQAVKHSKADISKISCAVAPKISNTYNVLRSGAALGRGNAPLLVSKYKIYPDEIAHCKIATPGYDTTANLLLKHNFGDIKELKEYLFSDIMDAVASNEVDAGMLIHEERFSYEKYSLNLIIDLSERWNKECDLPIPLGLIAINNRLEDKIKYDISKILRNSIDYAFSHPKSSWDFIKQHSQSLSDEIIESHIEMFVNKYSVDIEKQGELAIEKLFAIASNNNTPTKPIFF